MDPLRRLNHWVPASYLAAFTETGKKEGLLNAYRRDSPNKLLRLPPRALAKERDLYVFERPDGELDDSIERMLAEHIEGPFLPIRNRLAFGQKVGLTGKLSHADEDALYFFLAFQQVRTPRFREQLNLLASFEVNVWARSKFSDLERVKRDLEQAHGREFALEEVQEMRDDLERGELIIEPNEKAWLEHALRLAVELRPVLATLPRAVFHAPKGLSIPTSDNPLVVVRRHSKSEYVHGGGWHQPHTEAVLALSPESVLVIGNALAVYDDQGSKDWFHQLRHRIASGAGQWLFTSIDDRDASAVFWNSEHPRMVIEYPGGTAKPGDSMYAAVQDLMNKNPGEAIIRFGPEI